MAHADRLTTDTSALRGFSMLLPPMWLLRAICRNAIAAVGSRLEFDSQQVSCLDKIVDCGHVNLISFQDSQRLRAPARLSADGAGGAGDRGGHVGCAAGAGATAGPCQWEPHHCERLPSRLPSHGPCTLRKQSGRSSVHIVPCALCQVFLLELQV